MAAHACALLREVAETLMDHGHLRCRPTIDEDDGRLVVTLVIEAIDQSSMTDVVQTVELFNGLRYVCDVAQIRAFASRYGIEPAALERLLPHTEDSDEGRSGD